MTVEEIAEYYADLLIIQYICKPKARAHIKALATEAIMENLPLDIKGSFDVSLAVGDQLDILGKYIGVGRTGSDFNGSVTLNDSDYRTVLQMKTFQNNSGASLAEIQEFLNNFFPGQIQVTDFLNMRIGYFLDSSIGDQSLVEFFINEGILPKPMGVQISSTIYGDELNSFFGYRNYNGPGGNNSPYNSYSQYELDRPFLTYDDALIQ